MHIVTHRAFDLGEIESFIYLTHPKCVTREDRKMFNAIV